jgi:hypothetical protein
MTEQRRLIVDVTDVLIRLHCKCGSTVAVSPDRMKRSSPRRLAHYKKPPPSKKKQAAQGKALTTSSSKSNSRCRPTSSTETFPEMR